MPKTYRLLAALYAVLVVALSSWPRIPLPDLGTSHVDKILHFGQYLVFAFLVAKGWGGSGNGRISWRKGILFVILISFAAVDEYHQGWIPGRDPDVRDWIADAAGIALGFWIGTRHRRVADTSATP